MMGYLRLASLALVLAVLIMSPMNPGPAAAATAAEINRDVNSALQKLYARRPEAKMLAKKAKGILVFPHIVKAGFVVGGQFGEGSLRIKGKTVGYYNTVQASYGLQAGAQSYGYALFIMTESALNYLKKTSGWEIGVGPSVVVVDEGMGKNLTTTTLRDDIYGFVFDQKGLMAGLGLQGTKITRIEK